MAAAIRIALAEFRNQREFTDALSAAGYPVEGTGRTDTVSGWVLGAEPEKVSDVASITIVPAWALVAAAEVSKRSVGELLTMAGVEGQEPLIDRVHELGDRVDVLEELLYQVAGLPDIALALERKQATEKGVTESVE
jgi:hypothetical protein